MGGFMMLLNITNHPSRKLSSKQITASEVYGEIVDMPFPSISPYLESREIDVIVGEYLEKFRLMINLWCYCKVNLYSLTG